MPNATANAPIRTRAIAESETLTASTPASWRRRAASIVRSIRTDRGGSISTETTNRRAASSSARRVGGRAARGPFEHGSVGQRGARLGRGDLAGRGGGVPIPRLIAPSAARIAAMCPGVVPQHPPTIRAPASTIRGVTCAK